MAELGPFDPARLPRTKLALVMAVDEALRKRDPARLGALFVDAAAASKVCSAERVGTWAETRRRAARELAACLELADLSSATYLVLNYGSRVNEPTEGCPKMRGHEKSELYYAVGDAIIKVTLAGAYTYGDRHALTAPLRCHAKRGSATEMMESAKRFGQRCPGQPWPFMTQVRGACPSLR